MIKMVKFKNDKERIAFLEDHENEENGWYLWKHDDDLARYWFRFDLDDCSSPTISARLKESAGGAKE